MGQSGAVGGGVTVETGRTRTSGHSSMIHFFTPLLGVLLLLVGVRVEDLSSICRVSDLLEESFNKLIGNSGVFLAIIDNRSCWPTLSSSSFCWIWQLI